MTFPKTEEITVVFEWGSDPFHRKVVELEKEGYIAREGSYNITAETNPETGEVIHLHTIEMVRTPLDD